jgi:hypothetical protein
MIGPLLTLVAWTGMGLLVFWRRQSDPRAVRMSTLTALIGPGLGGFYLGLAQHQPEWWLISRIIQVVSMTGLLVLVLVIPTGQVKPRWTLWPILYLIILNAINQFFPSSALAFGGWSIPLILGLFFGPLLASLGAIPVYRYRHVLTGVERQQFKWVGVGIATFTACMVLLLLHGFSCRGPLAPAQEVRCSAAGTIGYGLAPLAMPIFIGVAILRSRLWDIDVIIRRTLIYSALTGILAVAYFGGILVLQSLFGALTGERQNTLATVLSTLAIAALAGPMRRRVQEAIDRRFYRRKYDAARTLAGFGAQARDVVELEQLTDTLLVVVEETMQPAQASMWVRPPAIRRGPLQ